MLLDPNFGGCVCVFFNMLVLQKMKSLLDVGGCSIHDACVVQHVFVGWVLNSKH